MQTATAEGHKDQSSYFFQDIRVGNRAIIEVQDPAYASQEAEPIDRTIASYEGGRSAIAD